MKKIIIAFLLFATLSVNAQKDSTKKDTVAILSLAKVQEIITVIQIQESGKADIKPTVWDGLIRDLVSSIKIIPNKEQPKK